MHLKPNKNYFLVRILKAEQRERKDKIGSIVIPPALVFQTRNMQCGEIIGVGENCKKYFPEAQVGHILIFHHFVEHDGRLVKSDENYNYYVVAGWEWVTYQGEVNFNETYAIYDGEKIITHPDFIFLDVEPPAPSIPLEETMSMLAEHKESGLQLFKEWRRTREDMQCSIDEGRKRIMSLSKSRMTPEIAREINKIEAEQAALGAEMHKKVYIPYNVAAENIEIAKTFDKKSIVNHTIFCMNRGCETRIEFMEKEYLICNKKFIGFLLN